MSYNLSVQELFKQSYQNNQHGEAVFDGYKRLTYQELQVQVEQIASALTQMGVVKGDRVIVSLPNWNEFLTIYFSVAQIGAIIIPVNPQYKTTELSYILENSGAKVIFIREQNEYLPMLESKLQSEETNSLENIITVRFKTKRHHSFEELLTLGKKVPSPQIVINPSADIFAILYTSGTTGQPKGVMLTHKNFVHTAIISAERLYCTQEDVFLVAVPVYHVFGMIASILSAIYIGAKLVLIEKYDSTKVLELIQNERVSIHHGVPSMFIKELNDPNLKQFDLSSLRTGIIAGAPCPKEVVDRVRIEMGCDIVIAYGMTETSSTLTMTHFDEEDRIRSQTVGKAVLGAEVKIVDSLRKEVPMGQVGELACRSEGVMKGYYRNQENATEIMDKDGWFYTGDMAVMDQEGYVRIVGRQKDMIIRGGFNIYPQEIETILYEHPNIFEVAIVAIPDEVLGELTCAAIKLLPDYVETEATLREYLKERIVKYKIPDKIIFVETLPKTASGKISKIKLKTVLINELSKI